MKMKDANEEEDDSTMKSSSLTNTSETTTRSIINLRRNTPHNNASIISTNKLLDKSSNNENSIISHNLSFLTLPEEDDESQAWCIVICCFLVNIVVMGFLKCLGILTIEVQKSYRATPADVSVLVSIISLLNCIAGPLACYLVMKFTARTIAFCGTVLVTLGLMLSWFATSITFLYFSIGVLVGLGSGLTYSPGLILIGNYSGSPVGGMIIPFLLNFLIRYLDCRGTFLILGGLMMNAVICTLSYKPYRPSRPNKRVISSKEVLLQARRTEAQIHIPDYDGDGDSSTSSVTELQQVLKDEEDSSDDSSGPEIMLDEDAGNLNSQIKIKKMPSVISTGSVIVYKINEKYGQRNRKHGQKSSGKPHPVLSKPLFWRKPEEHDAGKMRKLSGTGQNIESKMSQTEIHPKLDVKNRFNHPFSSLVKQTRGSGGGGPGLGSSSGKVVPASPPIPEVTTKANSAGSSKGHPSSTPAPQNSATLPTKLNTGSMIMHSGSLAQSQIGSQTIGSQASGISGVRQRKLVSIKDQQKKEQPSPQAVSTKKLSPYILSLDHSCVIMWSNDNLARGQIPPKPSSEIPVTKLFEGGGDMGTGGSHTDHEIIVTPDVVGITPASTAKKKGRCCSRCLNWIRHSPLTYPTYLILLFSNATTAIATTNVLLLIPALGEHRGLSKAESSTVYLIISLTDLCSRLFGNFIYDRKYLSPKLIFACGLLFAGTSSFFIGSTADNFLKFCCFGGLFGFSSGFHIGIFGALLAEVVGIPLLPLGYAFCMILNGILQFSFINISGKILSSNPDAYTDLYSFYGTCLVFGGGLWSIPFVVGRFRKIHLHRLQKKKNNFSNHDSNKEDENLGHTGGNSNSVNGIDDKNRTNDIKTKSQSEAIVIVGKTNPRPTGMSNISLF